MSHGQGVGLWCLNEETRNALELPRLIARLLRQLSPVLALLLYVRREMLGRVEHRDDADVDQPLLAELRLVADRHDLVVQPLDDILRRPGGRDEAEIDRGEIGETKLAQ